jgi:hypothetical protein
LLDSMFHGISRNEIACLCIRELKMLEWGLCFGVKKKVRAKGVGFCFTDAFSKSEKKWKLGSTLSLK